MSDLFENWSMLLLYYFDSLKKKQSGYTDLACIMFLIHWTDLVHKSHLFQIQNIPTEGAVIFHSI